MKKKTIKKKLPLFLCGDAELRDSNRQVAIHQIDCLEYMDKVILKYPKGIFDTIVVDPPYHLSNGGSTLQGTERVSVNKGSWDVSQGIEQDHAFDLNWIAKCQKLLKSHGTIWISGTFHSIFSVGFAMQQLKLKIINDVIWSKPVVTPNLSQKTFVHSTETIIFAGKHIDNKHTFNYKDMKKTNGNKQMRNLWSINVIGKEDKKFGKHITQKPVKLLERIVLAGTQPGDIVFDPFMGSGTSGVAALKHGRRFVGCEINSKYIELSRKRINDVLWKRQGV